MQSPGARAAAAVLLIAAVVALFVVLRDDGDEDAATTATTAAETTTHGHDETSTNGHDETSAGGESREDRGSDERKPKPEVTTIEVRGGQPVGGVAELTFEQGERIRFDVSSDVADEIHLHGYDVYEDVPAGGTAEIDVPATIAGVFEAELHDQVVPVAEITVEPS